MSGLALLKLIHEKHFDLLQLRWKRQDRRLIIIFMLAILVALKYTVLSVYIDLRRRVRLLNLYGLRHKLQILLLLRLWLLYLLNYLLKLRRLIYLIISSLSFALAHFHPILFFRLA